MARVATASVGLETHYLTFNQVAWRVEFDGICASASLLHVPRGQLTGLMAKLRLALRPGGRLYVPMEYGKVDRQVDSHSFTDVTEPELDGLHKQAGSNDVEFRHSHDVRPVRAKI